ncbi:hypothetical protein GQ457_11G023530 [Hibiscus cannabinus]
MDGFGSDGVRVNPELGSDNDKSNELNSDHDSDSDGPRKWDLTGIPCVHAVLAIHETNRRPESYVHECYNKSTQTAIYSNIISPLKVTDMEPILPRTIKRLPRRPTKKRKKKAAEVVNPKLSKRGQQANYTKCGKTGHNKQTCRGEVGANQPIRRPTSSSQEQQPGRQKISIRQSLSPPTVVRWMPNVPSSQQSIVSNPLNQELEASTREKHGYDNLMPFQVPETSPGRGRTGDDGDTYWGRPTLTGFNKILTKNGEES